MSGREVRDNPAEQRFEVLVDGRVAGFARYQLMGEDYAFTHTEIDDAYEGQGLGSALVRGLLETTRDRGAAVLPYCPFVRGYIERHPEYLPLVPESRRARFDLPT
jgi:predicted GNAT family acetyltransferase